MTDMTDTFDIGDLVQRKYVPYGVYIVISVKNHYRNYQYIRVITPDFGQLEFDSSALTLLQNLK